VEKEIKATELVGFKNIRCSADFVLLIAIAAWCKVRKDTLDMEGIVVPNELRHENSINQEVWNKMCSLAKEGVVTNWNYTSYEENEESIYDSIDMEQLNQLELTKNTDTECIWNLDYARDTYNELLQSMPQHDQIRFFMFCLIAKQILDKDKRTVVMQLDNIMSGSLKYFLYIELVKKNHPQFKNVYRLEWDSVGVGNLDIGYSLFYMECLEKSTLGEYTIGQKIQQIEDAGIKKGDLLALYERGKMSEFRSTGDIIDVSLVEYLGHTGTTIKVRRIYLSRTKAELQHDYDSLDDGLKAYYEDVVSQRPTVDLKEYDLYSVAIGGHFSINVLSSPKHMYTREAERYILNPLDKHTTTTIYTNDGLKEMREVEAVEYMLHEYDIPYDEQRFKERYYADED
jgi:hypothetical protein